MTVGIVCKALKVKIEQMVSLPLDCDNPGSRCKNRARTSAMDIPAIKTVLVARDCPQSPDDYPQSPEAAPRSDQTRHGQWLVA